MKFNCIINISNIINKPFEKVVIDKIKDLLKTDSYYFILNVDTELDLKSFIFRNDLSNLSNVSIKDNNEESFVWYRISNYYSVYDVKLNYRYYYVTDGSENSLINALDNFYYTSNFVINKISNKKNELQHRNNTI